MDNLTIVYLVTSMGQLVFSESTPSDKPLHFHGSLQGPELSYDITLLLFDEGKLVDHRLLAYGPRELYFILNTVPLQMVSSHLRS